MDARQISQPNHCREMMAVACMVAAVIPKPAATHLIILIDYLSLPTAITKFSKLSNSSATLFQSPF